MPDSIVRSGVAHTVVTNEITKNAINPRNQFIETDPTNLEDISDAFAQTTTASTESAQALTQPVIQESDDTHTSLSMPKTHITTHLQKLAPEKPTDKNLFFESLQKLEDRIHHLRAQHPTQNEQSVGSIESTHDRFVYKEKKNISKNVQYITESTPARASANLPSSPVADPASPIHLETVHLEQMSVDDMNVLLDEAMNSFNEDELRARIRKMKERLASANQTLKEIEDQDAKDSSQEP